MNPLLMSLLILTALTVFGRTMVQKIQLLKALEPADRSDHLKKRLIGMLTLAVGQKRLVGRARERSSGIMHALIFWGFGVLLIRSLTLYGEGFQKGYHLPFLGGEPFDRVPLHLPERCDGRPCPGDDSLGHFPAGRSETESDVQPLRGLSDFNPDRYSDGVRFIIRRRALQSDSII